MDAQIISMRLVEMGEYRSRDTVAVLKCLLERARAGELDDGLVICAKPKNSPEELYRTGAYARSRALAIFGVSLMWKHLVDDEAES